MNNPKDAVYQFIADNKLFKNDKNALIAFSGGCDSTCLLHILSQIPEIKLTAIHLNHNWRGEESDREEAACQRLCKEFNVDFYSEKLPPDTPHTETAARDARYKFYEKCSEKFKASIVFTAHNANDNAETIIYRISKGTAVDGLSGILPVRDIYCRPLLKTSREDIEQYCLNNSLEYNNDSSNNDTKYKRNLIRHKVLPILKDINSDIISAINSLSELAGEESVYLNNIAERISGNTKEFCLADKIIQTRAIKQLLVNNGLDYDREKIELLRDFIICSSKSKSGKTFSLTNNMNLYANYNNYYILNIGNKNNYEEIIVDKEGKYNIGNNIFSIEKCSRIPDKFPADTTKTAYINIPKIDFTLRYRQDGDFIYPMGLKNHRQKLKKYLNEKKIPNHIKDTTVLLCDGKEVLWAAGCGISDKIKIDNKVTHFIQLYERVK